MQVTVYGQLRSATGEKTVSVDFEGGTVGAALSTFVEAYPRAAGHLYSDGDLAPSVRVSVDGESVGVEDDCPPDAALSVHPAMQGG
jgi:molybdopterin synthase sulfur carrier subunit